VKLEYAMVYVPKHAYGAGKFPARMRYLHPSVIESWIEIANDVVVSDMYRSAESSLQARRDKKGVQKPGFSGHNYGFSIDIDVAKTMKLTGLRTKKDLDESLSTYGWTCHRLDHVKGSEWWHYNYGVNVKPGEKSSAPALERKIQHHYGLNLNVGDLEVQYLLKRLRFYGGALDGKHGPLTNEATKAFCRAWDLPALPPSSPLFTRTLAFVSAEKVIV
jgi:hypothetical protein